ncbi:MAG: hypothetical protein ACI4PF_01870 [Christensenellales bacterium]
MKGKNKYIVPLLLAGITSTAGVVTTINQQQQTMVQAEQTAVENMAGVELRMKSGFDDIYQLGDEIEMPTVEFGDPSNTADLVYTIKRGTKTVKVIDKDTAEANRVFKPTYTGAYSVTIEAVKEGVVTSKIDGLTIVVEKADAVIKLPTNSKYVIPAKIPTEQTNFKIPAPKVEVTDDNGDEIEATGELKVSLVTPASNEPIELSRTADDTDPYYAVNAEDLEEAGTYQIKYEYIDNGVVITRLESNFQVVKDLDTSNIDLRMKLQGSVPSTGNVNTDISVPKVTVLENATSTDGINAHITITYTKINDDGSLGTPKEIDYENYTFRPTEEGNYILSYKADLQELYGLSTDFYKPSTIIKVTDNKEPSVRPTYEYDAVYNEDTQDYTIMKGGKEVTSENSSELLVNRKADVPSIVIAGEPFVLPAIYGEDNFSDWQDITFTREIVGNNIAKKSFVSTLEEGAKYPANKEIVYVDEEKGEKLVLNQPGNYEIRYIAKDAAGKQIRATYTLVVKDAEDVTDAETEIKMSIGVSSITNKETLTFSKPTATDTYDSEVDVVTKYELYDKDPRVDDTATLLYTSEPLTKVNTNNKYELNIKEILTGYDTATYLRVVTTATVDNYRAERTTPESKYIKLIVVNPTTDDAPVFSISGAVATDADAWNNALFTLESNKSKVIKTNGTDDVEVTKIEKDGYAWGKVDDSDTVVELKTAQGGKLAAFDQGKDSVELPAVKFYDTDENLKIKLTITDNSGNLVTKNEYENISKVVSGDGWLYTISGASFKMSAYGIYTITYRAEDVAGNVTVKSFGIRVNDKTAPTIVIEDEDKFGGDVEVGEFFEVPVGNLIKNGSVLENRDVEWQVYGGLYERTSTGFYPLESGTYYVKYYGTDDMGNMQLLQDDSLFYINAKDTTAPVFNDDSSISIPSTMAWNPTEDPETNEKQMKIYIPVVYATDPIKNEPVDVVCTVTGPDGSVVKIKSDDDYEDQDYFIAKKQGKYTIKYEATDSANNTINMTKELALGDCIEPTIEWKNGYSIPEKVDLNGTLELKLGDDYFTLKDNVSKSDYLADNMIVKLVKPDGTTELKNTGTPGKNYKWTLTETGTYTLSITVKDEAGMSNVYKYSIEVPSEEPDDKTISPVVGTILVVASVVILGGVVIYFVVSSRKKATVRSGKSKKKD